MSYQLNGRLKDFEAKPMIPKKKRAITTLLLLTDLELYQERQTRLQRSLQLLMARLNEDDQKESFRLSFSYSWVFLYSSSSQIPFSFSGRISERIPAFRCSRYLSSKKPVTGNRMIRKKTKLYIKQQAFIKKEAGRLFKINVE